MSRVVTSTFVSLDGVMEAPEKWQLTNALFDDEMGKFVFESYAQAGSLLLGRVTYQEFAGFWPTQSDEDPFAQKLNGLPKYVVSKTLKTLEWKNSTKISGDLRQEISQLKARPGGDILLVGSAQLVNGLTEHGLIDEYQLLVHPIIVGRGKHLFKDGVVPTLLKLVDTKTFGTGAIALTFQPTGRATLG